MKGHLKTILYIFAIIILIFSGSYLFLRTFEDKIEQKVIQQVNSYFVTKIEIGSISLTFFKKFPNISIVLKNVSAEELALSSHQKVASASKIYLTVNIFNFLKKKYIIERIEVNNLVVNLKQYKNKKNNYTIWKTSGVSSGKEEPFHFDLNKIKITNARVFYTDAISEIEMHTDIQRLDFKGNFSDKKSMIHASLKSVIRNLKTGETTLFKDYEFIAQSEIQIDHNQHKITFENSNFSLNEASFLFNGNMISKHTGKNLSVNLHIKSNEFELQDFLGLLPLKIREQMKDLTYNGRIELNGDISGLYGKNNMPNINISFRLNQGSLKSTINNLEVKNIFFIGNYTNGNNNNLGTSKVEINEFSASVFEKEIKGGILIENFELPYISINADGNIDLDKFQQLIKLKHIKTMNGNAIFHIDFRGKYDEIRSGKTSGAILDGKFNLEQANLQLDSNELEYNDLGGSFVIAGNDLIISGFKGKISLGQRTTDFNLNGTAINFTPRLFTKDQKVIIKANLISDFIDMNQFIPSDNDEKTKHINNSAQNSSLIILPDNTEAILSIKCNSLIYRKFLGKDFRGKIRLNSGQIFLDSLEFNSAGGHMSMSGRMEQIKGQYFISGLTIATGLDITKLFIIFNNFEQHFIVDKNVKGKVSGMAKINLFLNPDISVDEEKLFIIADLNIQQGELINFEPLIDLMGFVKMKKMKNVIFDKIENILIIKNRKIIIPTMNLNSNAFSISVAGEHTFDNNLNYNLRVNLTDLFFGRNHRDKNEYVDGEDDLKGGLNLYVIMYGNGDNIKYKFDKVALRKNFKNKYENQRKEVKEILKKENQNPKNTEEEFEFKWDE